MAMQTELNNGHAHKNSLEWGSRALGLFGIGLGIAELVAPRDLGRTVGIHNHALLIRTMGLREIAVGIGVLAEERPLWSMTGRVAGDVLDLALLGANLRSRHTNKNKIGSAIGAVAGVTALDIFCAMQLAKDISSSRTIRTVQTIAINRTPEECYQFWRNLTNLPRFMKHLQSVRITGDGQSHWVAKAPAGTTVEWDAQTIHDSPDHIAWRSMKGSQIYNAGSVVFERATKGHGTILRVVLEYKLPGGKFASLIAKIFGEEPAIQLKSDLRRFKAVIETGEVPTIEGQSSGRALSTT